MKINFPFTLSLLTLLPLSGMAQTAAEINPFARQFVTAEQLSQQAQPNPASPTPALPIAVMPLPAPVDLTRSTPMQAKPLADAARVGPSAPTPAPPPPPPPPPPRFIPEEPRNTGSQIYFEGKGEAKDGHYGNTYGQAAPRLNSAGMLPAQVKILAPLISALHAQGVDDGKISIELNRLTPAQFAHWARQVLQ